MTDFFQDITTITPVLQTIVAKLCTDEVALKGILSNYVQDWTPHIGPGMTALKIPSATSFLTNNKVASTADTHQVVNWKTQTLTIDKIKRITVRVEDAARTQGLQIVEQVIVERMATSLTRQLDADILPAMRLAYPGDGSANNGNRIQMTGNSHTTLALADILLGNQILDEYNIDQDGRFLVVSPAQRANLLGMVGFSSANPAAGGVLINGLLGTLFGIPVVVYSGLARAEAILMQKSHVAFGRQQAVKFEAQRAPLEFASDDFAIGQMYGILGGVSSTPVTAAGTTFSPISGFGGASDYGYQAIWFNGTGT